MRQAIVIILLVRQLAYIDQIELITSLYILRATYLTLFLKLFQLAQLLFLADDILAIAKLVVLVGIIKLTVFVIHVRVALVGSYL